MNWNDFLKFLACGFLLGSLYGLVLLNKMDAGLYVATVMSVLTGLGALHAMNRPATTVTPSLTVQPKS